jgi:hypothetical protein
MSYPGDNSGSEWRDAKEQTSEQLHLNTKKSIIIVTFNAQQQQLNVLTELVALESLE